MGPNKWAVRVSYVYIMEADLVLKEVKLKLGEETRYPPEQEDILSGCFDLIYPTLLRMTGNRETALDLTQETFLKAWEKRDSFEGRSSFSTWVYRIGVNLTLNYLRRMRKVVYTEIDPSVIIRELPEEKADDRFMMAAIRESIMSLQPNLRVCIILHYYDSKSVDEISEVLGIARGTAGWRLHSARKKLKRELKQRGIQY